MWSFPIPDGFGMDPMVPNTLVVSADIMDRIGSGLSLLRDHGKKVQKYVWKNRKFDVLKKPTKSLVNIVLIEAKDLPDDQTTTCNGLYCKFKLGNESHKSRQVLKTKPAWCERFNIYLYEENNLEVSLWHKGKQKNFMGRCVIDLSRLEKEKTHDIWQELECGYGFIHMLITVNGSQLTRGLAVDNIPTSNNVLHPTPNIEEFSWYRLKNNWNEVGQLSVTVYGARGLSPLGISGKADAYCVLVLDNSRIQTHTVRGAAEPMWNKSYTFAVNDITSTLDIKVHDESIIGETLGKISIPLLRIINEEKRWYALKDKTKKSNAKGNCPRILLQMSIVWNPLKAALRTLSPKETKYDQKTPKKFSIPLIYNNLLFIKDIFNVVHTGNEYLKNSFEWENREKSVLALCAWLVFWFFFRMWMTPLLVLLPFLYYWTGHRSNSTTNSLSNIYGSEDELSEEDLESTKDEKTIKTRLYGLQELTFTIKDGIDYIVSLLERVKNLLNFTIPYLSYLAMAAMVGLSVAFYLIPANYIFMALGIYKFTRKYLNPDRVPNNDILDFISRVPDDRTLVFPSDKMPPYICTRCKFFMDLNFEFKRICRSADENILQFIQNGTTLESLNWPPSLKKIFQLKSKGKVPAEVPVMKTVIEGGATVQVSTQDLSDTDMEDDENVYNIKIGDGPDDESNSARIKVITTDNSKEKTKSSNKGYSSITKLTRHVRTHAGQRSYPCKFCNKSFVKSHHYTRHLRAKHASQSASRAEPEEQFRCEQCDDAFSTQDDLIYHSAIHATQNLICPLCQEKFDDVDAVTAHIKSHVNGLEFMCDYCELIFTEREKLDNHVATVHDEEIISEVGQDDSSIEMDAEDAEEEEDDDNPINLTEENGEMVVEIKKAENFMLDTYKGEADPGVTVDNTEHNSEDSEIEMTFTDMSRVDPVTGPIKDELSEKQPSPPSAEPVTLKLNEQSTEKCESQTASILRKAEEVKRKTQSKIDAPQEKKDKPNNNNKVESSTPVGASDKSLRLLEKELQDLKRTNTRSEPFKTSTKSLESLRSRRPQIHTSTPKTRPVDEKKPQLVQSKLTLINKKIQEKRALTKENKEPKEAKDTKNNSNAKDEKEVKEVIKDKTGSKNGTSEKREDGPVRRSARPSKIRDYAKMIRDNSQNSDFSNEESDNDDSDDNEFKETEIPPETRMKQRRASVKPVVVAKQAQTSSEPTPTPPRKRGRPRKDSKLPPKIKKEDKAETKIEQVNLEKSQKDSDSSKLDKVTSEKEDGSKSDLTDSESGKPNSDQNAPGGVLVSPTTGQTLKKVPIKALPPGVKPLPLLANTRLGSGEVCEMQIGKKLVKVQKIVMTKAEVEAMAKKGLVEMKDGTMVLKQGIKIPTADNNTLKSTSIGEGYEASKESPKKERGAPTRCDIGDDSLK